MLVIIGSVCALGAMVLVAYCVVLLRRRNRANAETQLAVAPATPAPPQVAVHPAASARLPGMPPERGAPAPPSWTAVERKLETPRAARGSVPPRKIAPNRFDDVLTAGLPVVAQPRQNRFDDDIADDDSAEPSKR